MTKLPEQKIMWQNEDRGDDLMPARRFIQAIFVVIALYLIGYGIWKGLQWMI